MSMISSKQVYRSLSKSTIYKHINQKKVFSNKSISRGRLTTCIFGSICTCKGVLSDARLVKPTISLKKSVAESKVSAVTGCPLLSSSATDLSSNKTKQRSKQHESEYKRCHRKYHQISATVSTGCKTGLGNTQNGGVFGSSEVVEIFHRDSQEYKCQIMERIKSKISEQPEIQPNKAFITSWKP